MATTPASPPRPVVSGTPPLKGNEGHGWLPISDYVRTGVSLLRHGVTPITLFLWPLRLHRRHPWKQIDLKHGVSMISPPEEPLVGMFREIWINHYYTPRDLRIPPGHSIVDLGADVGVFTVWAAMNSPESPVVAVEPSARACHFLRQNISRNHLGNAAVLQAACGGRRGVAVLYSRGPCDAWNTLYSQDRSGCLCRPSETVEVFTLEELFQRASVRTCGLLKLDCEGAEYEILFGASHQTLARIERIALEYHTCFNERTPEALVRFLQRHSFVVESLHSVDEWTGYLYATRSN